MKDDLLRLVAEYDLFGYITWDSDLNFFVWCDDVFPYNPNPKEAITKDNIELLKRSVIDGGSSWGPLLFCARSRGQLPRITSYYWAPTKIKECFNSINAN